MQNLKRKAVQIPRNSPAKVKKQSVKPPVGRYIRHFPDTCGDRKRFLLIRRKLYHFPGGM